MILSCGFGQELDDSLSNIIDDLKQTYSAKYHFHDVDLKRRDDVDFKRRQVETDADNTLIKTVGVTIGKVEQKYENKLAKPIAAYDHRYKKKKSELDMLKTHLRSGLRTRLREYRQLSSWCF